jgi:hypothetical protein
MPFNHQGERSNKGHQSMAARQKTIASMSDTGEPVPTPSGQGKQPEAGQFRLQVDRQTKSSYVSYEAAEQAGLVIKQAHPVVQVAVYDAVGGVNKVLELPKAWSISRTQFLALSRSRDRAASTGTPCGWVLQKPISDAMVANRLCWHPVAGRLRGAPFGSPRQCRPYLR